MSKDYWAPSRWYWAASSAMLGDQVECDRARAEVFRVNPDFINLENGYYSLMAEPVTTAQVEDLRMINAHHSFYMRRQHKED